MAGVAAIYAQALLQLADERGKRRAIIEDCVELARVLHEQPTLLTVLDDPRVGRDGAKRALAASLNGKIQVETLDLLRLLVDRNRLRDAAAIVSEVVRQAGVDEGVVHVVATTAASLSPAAAERLQQGMKRALGAGATVRGEVDPKLIGGLTLRVGDMLVDGSVRRQLSEMKNLMLSAPADQRLWDG